MAFLSLFNVVVVIYLYLIYWLYLRSIIEVSLLYMSYSGTGYSKFSYSILFNYIKTNVNYCEIDERVIEEKLEYSNFI